MSKIKRHIIFCYLFFGILFSVSAQDIKKEFENYYTVARQKKCYWLEIRAVQYDSLDLKGRELAKTTIKVRGEDNYVHLSQQEIITQGEQVVMINHNDKKVVFYSSVPYPKDNKSKALPNFDVFLKKADSVIYEGVIGENKKYRLQMKSGKYSQVDLYFNIKTGFISEVTEYYKNANENFGVMKKDSHYNYLEVKNELRDDENLEVSEAVTKTKGKYVLTKKYKDYELEVF